MNEIGEVKVQALRDIDVLMTKIGMAKNDNILAYYGQHESAGEL